MEPLPGSAKDPYSSPEAIRFCELLAYTNVPPSVVIQILNGDLGRRYLPIGRQPGGLCLRYEIPQATFLLRYQRFIHFINDLLVPFGVSLYLTGNTISVVAKPLLEREMEKVIDYAKRCILHNEELLKTKGNKKKGSKKQKVSNEEAFPL